MAGLFVRAIRTCVPFEVDKRFVIRVNRSASAESAFDPPPLPVVSAPLTLLRDKTARSLCAISPSAPP